MTNNNKDISLSSIVYEKILAAIITGEYAVNQKLPTEAELGARYNVSRPIIREVLARLKEDNLIFTRRGSGSYVITRPEETVLQFAQISSIADIQRCFEFREILESSFAGYAALRRTKEQLNKIMSATKALEKAIEKRHIATEEDYAFHLAIAEASNNSYFPTTFASLKLNIIEGMNITRTLSLQSNDNRQQLVQAEHQRILEAIINCDAAAAEKEMKSHLVNARKRMFGGANPKN